ncbi:Toprim domain-containing protein [Shimia isoporae]|uniref:Toprim domain-containing protein n=1 Tax=Shimia isoporae TaxID=647720 RepID=A0A4R1NMJ8_9RHOB|nr:toprim domain-containing protein [Shimia isoporae]TCL09544.1 Toprim domain-containing protein [Shimia isoporae]
MRDRNLTPEELTQALGGEWRGNVGRAPCPAHDGTDNNLVISHGNNGIVMYCHSHGCDFRDITNELRNRGLWSGKPDDNWTPPSPAQRAENRRRQAQHEAQRVAKAKEQWAGSQRLDGTLGDRYLNRTRGRDGRGILDLRFHPRIFYSQAEWAPAMIAAVRNVVTGQFQGVHRTFLNDDGTKHANARTVKGIAHHGAIMLDPFDAVTTGLSICEGIEDGLAIRKHQTPVWAMLNKNNIAELPVLNGIEHLTIFADRDADEGGLNAAKMCRRRWQDASVEVSVLLPIGGKDADEVLA